jgi:hypothetical protein
MLALLHDLLSHAAETAMEAKLASPAMLVLDAVGCSRGPGRVLGGDESGREGESH